MSVERLIMQLHGVPLDPEIVRRPQHEGGIPPTNGVYAWWMKPGSLPDVTGPQHPDQDLELLYIGIAPARESSRATLRSRVCAQHLGGNIGSSTFRQSLAALLADREGWRAIRSGSRAQLGSQDNEDLSDWQRQYLRLRWAEHSQPWLIEYEVIEQMQPPLNLAGNRDHPFGLILAEARRSLRGT